LTDDSTARSARGLYGISVTSELSGIAPQTLRLYERRGLLTPSRTDGGTRRYSDDDLARLQRITELVDQGINLAGIAQFLDLEAEDDQLKSDYVQLELLTPNSRPTADRRPVAGWTGKTEGRGSDREGRREHRSARRSA
jgi:MerR family transcriptional regulator/heat shock protein HspR